MEENTLTLYFRIGLSVLGHDAAANKKYAHIITAGDN